MALIVLAVLVGPSLLTERDEGEGETAVVPTAVVESNVLENELAEVEQSVIPTTDGGTIALSDTVNGRVDDERPQMWVYEGEATTVDIRLLPAGDDAMALLVFPPGADEPQPYVDFSQQGNAEELTYYFIQSGTQFGVRDTNNDGADYTLSIKPSAYPTIEV